MPSVDAVNKLIDEIRVASASDLHYLALFGALALPDICGALGSADGTATSSKYKDWIRANVPEQAKRADEIYGLRCSLLHEGRAMPHGGIFPIAFTFPPTVIHNSSSTVNGQRVNWLAINRFVEEVTRGTERWLTQYGSSQTVTRNLDKFARLRPEGLPPHVVGRPVIA